MFPLHVAATIRELTRSGSAESAMCGCVTLATNRVTVSCSGIRDMNNNISIVTQFTYYFFTVSDCHIKL